MEIGFLSKHIWKEWTQYISGKYIEMGKGVYHFAIPDLSGNLEGEPISICEVKPEYRNGVPDLIMNESEQRNLWKERWRNMSYLQSTILPEL